MPHTIKIADTRTIEIHESTVNTYHDCMEMVRKARQWEQLAPDFDELYRRREIVHEMEHSLHRAMLTLMMQVNDHDGSLGVYRDMLACFFWRFEKSGYHGGLIFHKNHKEADAEVGTWSIHT